MVEGQCDDVMVEGQGDDVMVEGQGDDVICPDWGHFLLLLSSSEPARFYRITYPFADICVHPSTIEPANVG